MHYTFYMSIKKFFLFLLLSFPLLNISYLAAESTEETVEETEKVSFFLLFHEFGWNTLGTFTYGYGLPWLAGAAGTYGIIKSGADWQWNRFNVTHEKTSAYLPLAGVMTGTVLPVIVPSVLYFFNSDPDIQLTGLALGQAAMQAVLATSIVKAFTGRVPPHIAEAIDGDSLYQEDYSDEFRFGFWRGGIFNGWPSGHTATAVAMATTLVTLYPDNTAIKIGAIAYSAFIGFSMSFRAHWASDVFAGALAGYSIGRTVGKSYAKLRKGDSKSKQEKYSFIFYGTGLDLLIRL